MKKTTITLADDKLTPEGRILHALGSMPGGSCGRLHDAIERMQAHMFGYEGFRPAIVGEPMAPSANAVADLLVEINKELRELYDANAEIDKRNSRLESAIKDMRWLLAGAPKDGDET